MKITANDLDIDYRLDGPEDGQVVMFGNSLMSNYSMWDGQIASLNDKYRVLRYDQRGHGGTETTPGPYSIELLAEDARALLDALGIEAVHFIGLSMGGFTAQMLATLYPEKVLSLCLCDTACIMAPPSLWDERIASARSGGIDTLVAGTLERWFTPSFHTTGAAQLELVREMILGTGVEGYIGCAEAIRDMDICGNLAKISAPTLVLVGEGDPACTVEAAEILHSGIAKSELVIIPHAAHLPNIEQRERFNDLVVGFLERQ